MRVIVSNIFAQCTLFSKLITLNLYANIFELFFSPKEAALHSMSVSVLK